ncbi:MAG: DUF177 domain-containing protein [Nitrospinae bacterium]|nr:DUF177 domain-containing protein [Nitrospinota bacterium]
MVFEISEIGDEGLDFEIQQKKEDFAIDQADCSLNRDIMVRGRLTRFSEEVFLTGRVSTELTLSCSRCLEPFSHPVENKLKAHFVPLGKDSASSGEVELHSADIDTELYEEGRIDLHQSVRDGIFLTVPVICLCVEDCKGLCSHCGKNLNLGSCACSGEQSIDPRLEVLKTLKEKLK